MKPLSIFIVSIFLICGCSSNEKHKKNDWSELKLNGRVKSLKEITYKAVDRFGEIKGTDITAENYTIFDDKGNITELRRGKDKTITKYNNMGQRIEENYYKSDDSLGNKRTFIYDKKGNAIEIHFYGPDGGLSSKIISKYDDKGDMIESNMYLSNGDLFAKKNYKYDNIGQEIERNMYHSDGSLGQKRIYKYDSKGQRIEENYYGSDSGLSSKIISKYDDRGNKIEENEYNPGGNLRNNSTYKYKLDSNDNWTQKIEYTNYVPVTIVERILEYFNK
jgi:hypothetical protein